MRWVFILFLLLNVVYFGWELDRQSKMDRQGHTTSISSTSGAEKLTLVAESNILPQVYQPEPVNGSDARGPGEIDSIFVKPGNQLVTELPDIGTATLDTGASKKYCYTFGPIEEETLATGIGDWFNSRRAKTYIHYTDEKGSQLFWIYLTPVDSQQNTMDIIRELKDKGIEGYPLINKGELQNAISLGLYKGQTAVNGKIAELQEQGYKPVVVPYSDGKRVYWVDVQLSVDPGSLAAIFKGYPSRYNYVPVDCNRTELLATGRLTP